MRYAIVCSIVCLALPAGCGGGGGGDGGGGAPRVFSATCTGVPGLDAADFNRPAIASGIDHVAGSPAHDEFAMGVRAGIEEDLRVGWPTSDFRLRFALPGSGDANSDYLRLRDGGIDAHGVRIHVNYTR